MNNLVQNVEFYTLKSRKNIMGNPVWRIWYGIADVSKVEQKVPQENAENLWILAT